MHDFKIAHVTSVCLHSISQSLVAWPHLTVGEAEKCNFWLGGYKSMNTSIIILKGEDRYWSEGGNQLSLTVCIHTLYYVTVNGLIGVEGVSY